MKYYQIPIELVVQALELRDGIVYWKERPAADFAREASWKRHNTLFVGKEFGYVSKFKGSTYRAGTIRVAGKNRRLLYHVAVWVLSYGIYPAGVIDHIDGDGLNNNVENLRDIPQALNARNARKRVDNTSGVNGVYWSTRDKVWVAIGVEYVDGKSKQIRLGYFATLDGAAMERAAWQERQDGFSSRHGK